MDLSVVIPVYNERDKIEKDIRDVRDFFSSYNIHGEIIVVDDGSQDSTPETVKNIPPAGDCILNLVEIPAHRGKGHAVKTGIMKATGRVIMFLDSGSCIPYTSISRGLRMVSSKKCEIAHGSRRLPDSRIIRGKHWTRSLSSFLFRILTRLYLNLPSHLTDTQCGLKIYRGDVAHEIYKQCATDGFMFDLEIIMRAQRKNYRIREFPVEWTADPDSRLSFMSTFFRAIKDIYRIKKYLSKGNGPGNPS